MAEREEIRAGLERRDRFTAIAFVIGRAVSTVSREVTGKSGRERYRATTVHRSAGHRARRPKPQKLASGPLLDKVTEWLEEWWSPEKISHRLRLEFPHDPMMWMSHETIYQSLFLQDEKNFDEGCRVACGPTAESGPFHAVAVDLTVSHKCSSQWLFQKEFRTR